MKRILLIVSMLGALLSMTSCRDEEELTVALPLLGTAVEAIPIAIREEFSQHMTIYEGNNPPNIEGEYLIEDCVMLYSSDGQFEPGEVFADMYIAFRNQQGNYCEYVSKQGKSTSTASKVLIIGSANNFTAYFQAEDAKDDGVTTSVMSTMISGTVTPSGIANLKLSFILVSKNDPNHDLMDVNEYRVFYDGDELAERKLWYNGTLKSGDGRDGDGVENNGLSNESAKKK